MDYFLGSDHWVEIVGAATGLIYLYFSIKQSIWLWPWGIVTSLFYVFVFFQSKFYADMSLQFYYFAMSIYGWYFWKRGEKVENGQVTPVIRADRREWAVLLMITAVLTITTGYALEHYTDSPLPYWDAFTTAGSVVATWMLARKYLENWLFWIVVDSVSLGTYIYKELYPTVILFFVYTLLAFIGYRQWRKASLNYSGN